jgi:hypothetical protein
MIGMKSILTKGRERSFGYMNGKGSGVKINGYLAKHIASEFYTVVSRNMSWLMKGVACPFSNNWKAGKA